MTTDLTFSVEQIVGYYFARWKIESCLKEIKREIGGSKLQVRNADTVLNHLSFCMMATKLDPEFQSICPLPLQRPQKSFVKTLLRMVVRF